MPAPPRKNPTIGDRGVRGERGDDEPADALPPKPRSPAVRVSPSTRSSHWPEKRPSIIAKPNAAGPSALDDRAGNRARARGRARSSSRSHPRSGSAAAHAIPSGIAPVQLRPARAGRLRPRRARHARGRRFSAAAARTTAATAARMHEPARRRASRARPIDDRADEHAWPSRARARVCISRVLRRASSSATAPFIATSTAAAGDAHAKRAAGQHRDRVGECGQHRRGGEPGQLAGRIARAAAVEAVRR